MTVFCNEPYINETVEGMVHFILGLSKGKGKVVKYRKNDMFFDQRKYFVEYIRDDIKPFVLGEDGIRELEIAGAVLRVAREKGK